MLLTPSSSSSTDYFRFYFIYHSEGPSAGFRDVRPADTSSAQKRSNLATTPPRTTTLPATSSLALISTLPPVTSLHNLHSSYALTLSTFHDSASQFTTVHYAIPYRPLGPCSALTKSDQGQTQQEGHKRYEFFHQFPLLALPLPATVVASGMPTRPIETFSIFGHSQQSCVSPPASLGVHNEASDAWRHLHA